MINGIKLKGSNISPNQRRIRLMELGGIPISDRDKKNLQPRKGLLTESKQEELDMDEFISELMNELEEEDILREMGYYDDEDELEELHNVKVSKGYKEGRKLVDNLRRGLFRKLNNDELDDFVEVLKTSFGF